jgi:predicted GIY-YIG superfamily endonuclease
MYYVYVLKNDVSFYYKGFTENPKQRLKLSLLHFIYMRY